MTFVPDPNLTRNVLADPALRQALVNVANVTDQAVTYVTPVETGRAKYKPGWEPHPPHVDGQNLVVQVSNPAWYLKFQEFGTKTIPARRFVQRALNALRS